MVKNATDPAMEEDELWGERAPLVSTSRSKHRPPIEMLNDTIEHIGFGKVRDRGLCALSGAATFVGVAVLLCAVCCMVCAVCCLCAAGFVLCAVLCCDLRGCCCVAVCGVLYVVCYMCCVRACVRAVRCALRALHCALCVVCCTFHRLLTSTPLPLLSAPHIPTTLLPVPHQALHPDRLRQVCRRHGDGDAPAALPRSQGGVAPQEH